MKGKGRAKRTNEPIATTQDKKIVGRENEMKGVLSSRAWNCGRRVGESVVFVVHDSPSLSHNFKLCC